MTTHFRQAITTKYIGPSNVRGPRVKARAAAGSLTLPWNDAKNSEDNHAMCAWAIAHKLGWRGKWYGGVIHTGEHVFVNCDEQMAMECAFEIFDDQIVKAA